MVSLASFPLSFQFPTVQLEKLIDQVVFELNSLGFGPDLLFKVLVTRTGEIGDDTSVEEEQKELLGPRVVYEFNSKSEKVETRLRIWNTTSVSLSLKSSNAVSGPAGGPFLSDSKANPEIEVKPQEEPAELNLTNEKNEGKNDMGLALQRSLAVQDWVGASSDFSNDDQLGSDTRGAPDEIIIPLVNDSALFQLLSSTMHDLSEQLLVLYTGFAKTLEMLAEKIIDSARPVSSSRRRNFHPHSILSNPRAIGAPSRVHQSDLYPWREIFQLYVESEIFSTLNESHPGQHSIEETEKRLKVFMERVSLRYLGHRRRSELKYSREALEIFLKMNLFILDVQKFEQANAEATQKILQERTKRTSLPLPFPPGKDYFSHEMSCIFHSLSSFSSSSPITASPHSSYSPTFTTSTTLLFPSVSTYISFCQILVQHLTSMLLPIIPHLDDYTCIICTNIAFKPIRLECGHFFCVRCLVKMQKRGEGRCPICRASTVENANRSNVDWGLLNFMSDWFPLEAHEKLEASEKEAAKELFWELGFNPEVKCLIM